MIKSLCLYWTLFFQICKRRTKVLHSKSPAASKTPQKGYKHVELLPLQCVRKVLDMAEAEDCHEAFGLIVKSTEDLREKLYSFMMDGEEDMKSNAVTSLAKSIANTVCRTDYVRAFVCLSFLSKITVLVAVTVY